MSYRDELDAWRRTREATKRVMAALDRDEKGFPLQEDDEVVGDGSGHVLPLFDPTVERWDEL